MAGLYIHVPFCKSRCIYCDFYSTTRLAERDAYVDALCLEMGQAVEQERLPKEACRVETIYLGGGTPSQLTVAQLGRVFDAIGRYFSVTEDAEITLEANPDDLTQDFVRQLRRMPVNRLSMGVQTFDENRLRFLRRRHTAVEAVEAVKRCQDTGFDNVSIDLMYGFPGETLDSWRDDLQRAMLLGVQHLSAYALSYEPGTRLSLMLERGEVEEVDEEVSRQMYGQLIDTAEEHSFEHYEISNFCQPGRFSRHNSSYWNDTPYWGFGAGAHSYDGSRRSWNAHDLYNYIKGTRAREAESYRHTETLTLEQRYDERVMTRLRTRDGLSLNDLRCDFGDRLADYLLRMAAPHIDTGRLVYDQETDFLRLSREGIFVSDDIMSDLMAV